MDLTIQSLQKEYLIQKSKLDNIKAKFPQEVQVQDILEQKFQISHSYNHAIVKSTRVSWCNKFWTKVGNSACILI